MASKDASFEKPTLLVACCYLVFPFVAVMRDHSHGPGFEHIRTNGIPCQRREKNPTRFAFIDGAVWRFAPYSAFRCATGVLFGVAVNIEQSTTSIPNAVQSGSYIHFLKEDLELGKKGLSVPNSHFVNL